MFSSIALNISEDCRNSHFKKIEIPCIPLPCSWSLVWTIRAYTLKYRYTDRLDLCLGPIIFINSIAYERRFQSLVLTKLGTRFCSLGVKFNTASIEGQVKRNWLPLKISTCRTLLSVSQNINAKVDSSFHCKLYMRINSQFVSNIFLTLSI